MQKPWSILILFSAGGRAIPQTGVRERGGGFGVGVGWQVCQILLSERFVYPHPAIVKCCNSTNYILKITFTTMWLVFFF